MLNKLNSLLSNTIKRMQRTRGYTQLFNTAFDEIVASQQDVLSENVDRFSPEQPNMQKAAKILGSKKTKSD